MFLTVRINKQFLTDNTSFKSVNDSHLCLEINFSGDEIVIADKKPFLTLILLVLAICLCACSEMTKTEDDLPDYIDFDQLTEGYGVENAADDDCVVFVDSKLISGENVWKAFMTKVEKKQSCCVRIAYYNSAEGFFSLRDLSYEDSYFCVNTSEGLSGEYKYMNHYEIDIKSNDSDYSVMDCYILVNQENVTYDNIEKTLASSFPDGGVDYYTVYLNVY